MWFNRSASPDEKAGGLPVHLLQMIRCKKEALNFWMASLEGTVRGKNRRKRMTVDTTGITMTREICYNSY